MIGEDALPIAIDGVHYLGTYFHWWGRGTQCHRCIDVQRMLLPLVGVTYYIILQYVAKYNILGWGDVPIAIDALMGCQLPMMH